MKTRWKVLLGIAAVLVAARTALPWIAESLINGKLEDVEGWDARVGDVDLALLRGGVTLKGIEAENDDSSVRASIERVALDFKWSDLLERRLVASVEVVRPSAHLTLPPEPKARKPAERKIPAWPEPDELLPFRLERFDVREGELAVTRDGHTTRFTDAFLNVEGLTNLEKDSRAEGRAGVTVAKGGAARVDFRVDPTRRPPSFDLALDVDRIELPPLNPLLREEFGVDVGKGTFELVAEAESSGGGFKGYVKPFIKDLEMNPLGGEGTGPLKAAKEAAVGAAAAVLENQKTDAVAAKIPFEGRFENPDIGAWQAMVSVLRNAFVKALQPSFEGVGQRGGGKGRG